MQLTTTDDYFNNLYLKNLANVLSTCVKTFFALKLVQGLGIWYKGTENQLQVLIDFPRPASAMTENFYEDTMLLLEMIKDKRHKENREKKVSTI